MNVPPEELARQRTLGWAARLSLLFALIFAGIKVLAFWLTNSLAVLSDLLDSAVNIMAAIAVLAALAYASKPADEDHPYGHHKVENLAAILEAGLILLVAGSFAVLSYERLLNPQPLSRLLEGAALEGIVTVGTFGLAMYLIRVGRANDSVAIVADGRHLMADVVTTMAVTIGVLAVHFTGLVILDTLLTIGIVGYLVYTAVSVLVGAVRPLLDEALPEKELRRIEASASKALKGARLERLRTRRAGRVRFIDAIVVFPTQVSLLHAHRVANAVEHEIRSLFEGDPVDVQLHLEPPGAHGKEPPPIVREEPEDHTKRVLSAKPVNKRSKAKP